MGYTHYFPQTRAFTNDEWVIIKMFATKLFDAKKNILANGMGDLDTDPDMNSKYLSFNGIGDEAHETFQVTKAWNKEFNFCKTARKEYDIVVVAMLAIIDYIAPNVLTISSDGTKGDFYAGVKLAQEVVGTKFNSKLADTSW